MHYQRPHFVPSSRSFYCSMQKPFARCEKNNKYRGIMTGLGRGQKLVYVLLWAHCFDKWEKHINKISRKSRDVLHSQKQASTMITIS